ncbi:MAG: ParB/RepB/Spo0J family partition protein [Chloroflexi bacterium]|nr:ParB/RepB/Spo0J family partition protein [Chloroflexota bacterium]
MPARAIRTFRRGEFMLHAGRPADATFVIRHGVVRCFLLDAEGRETTTAVLGRGHVVGLAPWLGRTVHREFAEALTQVDASALASDELPAVQGLGLGSFAQRLELTLGVLKSVSLVPAKLREVAVQQRLSMTLGAGSSSLKATTMASLLQMRPETLARAKHLSRAVEPPNHEAAEPSSLGLQTFRSGEVVSHDEVPVGCVGHVLSGELRVWLVTEAQRAMVAEKLESGDLFSMGALLGLHPVGVKLIGVLPGCVEVLCARDFLRWLEEHPADCSALVTRFAQRLERLEATLVRARTHSVRDNLIHVLREIAPGAETQVPRSWSHQQLAYQIGVRRESVTRGLASLENAGLIRRHGRRIELVERTRNGTERSTMQQRDSNNTSITSCRLCGLRSRGPLCGGCAERLEFDIQVDRRRACAKCGRHVELCQVLPCEKELRHKSNGAQKPALVWLSVDTIDEPPAAQNSRHMYADKAIRELADSVRQDGLLQPICVRPKGTRYEVVFGIRRLRAAKQAGIHEIPASVRVADDGRAFLLNVLENLHREQLSAAERVRTIERLAATGLGVREISRRTGFNASTISRWLRVNGHAELKHALEEGSIDIARAVVLVEAPPASLPGLLQIAPTISVAELRSRVACAKASNHGASRSQGRGQLRQVLHSLRAIESSSDRDLLECIRREVDRLSAQP